MNILKSIALLAMVGALSACAQVGDDKGADNYTDTGDLADLKAGIWVDPEGCDHWIIDDGLEGYLMARLNRDGTPVCNGNVPPNTAYGPFRAGQGVADIL
jgi:hypothetical protein